MTWFWLIYWYFPKLDTVCQIQVYNNEEWQAVLEVRQHTIQSEQFDIDKWVQIQFGWYKRDISRVRKVYKNKVVVVVIPWIPVDLKCQYTHPKSELFLMTQSFV